MGPFSIPGNKKKVMIQNLNLNLLKDVQKEKLVKDLVGGERCDGLEEGKEQSYQFPSKRCCQPGGGCKAQAPDVE